MKNTTSSKDTVTNLDDVLRKTKFNELDPRSATFAARSEQAFVRMRHKADQALKAAEEELTASTELLKSAAFKEAARTDNSVRELIGSISTQAGERRKELQAQKALFAGKGQTKTPRPRPAKPAG